MSGELQSKPQPLPCNHLARSPFELDKTKEGAHVVRESVSSCTDNPAHIQLQAVYAAWACRRATFEAISHWKDWLDALLQALCGEGGILS